VIPGGAGFSRVAADDLLPPTLLALPADADGRSESINPLGHLGDGP